MKTEKRGKKLLYKLIMFFLLCVFLFSLYKVVDILLEYRQIDEIYDEAAETYAAEEKEEAEEASPIAVDFDELRKLNSDIIGWIYIPDTNVSFPLLQGSSNKQYLYQSYKKEYLTAGSIFLDYRCSADFEDKSTVIYGHNMHNGSMFGSLKKYKDEEYRDEHPYIYIMKADGTWKQYETLAYYQASVDGPTYRLPLSEAESEDGALAFRKLRETIAAGNMYSGMPKPEASDKLLLLSTCTQDSRDDVRMILAAKLVETIKTE